MPLVPLCLIMKNEYITETKLGRKEGDSSLPPKNFQSELGPDFKQSSREERQGAIKTVRSLSSLISPTLKNSMFHRNIYLREKQN